jgi:single-stranded-DNA-specific exonuclease
MKFIKKNLNVSKSLVNQYASEFNITPIIMEQIIARGNDSKEKIIEFLNPTKKSFHNPFLLKGMSEFVERIKKAIEKKENILVFGDYDVDGINATAIMLKTFKILGINANFYLPNRYIDGYGLTIDVIDKIKMKHNPNLIITVDCGISCYQEVAYAKSLGIEIIITDHHEIPEIIPEGIVINAKRTDQDYPFKELCGTGLAYKISQALIGQQAEQFLPIACIATISDIVPLVDENRAIVNHGFKKFNLLPKGIKEMFNVLNINLNKCTVNDISFKLAPKLNASGRMGNAKYSLYLYLTENQQNIKFLINKILNHNLKRQDLCCLVERDCEIGLFGLNLSKLPSIILSSKGWDQGILGIVCAKLVAKYNRPTFLFTEVNGLLKGAVRSIKAINIHKLLASMSDILETYGGHPIAAGLTLKAENYNTFVEKTNEYLAKHHADEIFSPEEEYDIPISINEITPKLARDVLKLEPCGCGNNSPKFYLRTKDFKFSSLKNYINHCNIKIGQRLNLIYFNYLENYNKLKKARNLDLIFELQTDKISSVVKGIVKSLRIDINDLNPFSQNYVIPEIEQLKYLKVKIPAVFSYFDQHFRGDLFELNNYFGTAYVVNSSRSFNFIKNNVDFEKIGAIDLYGGCENSGINCVFICPSTLNFVQSYKRIIFLDNIIHHSYIANINQHSDSEIFVNNVQNRLNIFSTLDNSRENFGRIFKDLEKFEGSYITLRDCFEKILKHKKINYSYIEFYSAFLVFIELQIISFIKENGTYKLTVNKNIKSQLGESNLYRAIDELKYGARAKRDGYKPKS